MILIIECIIACIIFSIAVVGSTVHNKTAWLNEYAPQVRERFLEKNPDYVPKTKKENIIGTIIAKLIVCIVFIGILTILIYLAGAKDFLTGAVYCYIIWFVVNLFDVFALDIGVFAHWKKVRLPGTEDMDKEYRSNVRKSLVEGLYGIMIGIPVALISGGLITLIT